jgi:hypothetical protein
MRGGQTFNAQCRLSSIEIETHDIDVLPNWHKIVEMSTRVTAIFNMIDIGDYFDAAVASLALKRKLPLISGGTFRTSLTVDFFRPEGNPCWLCSAGLEKKDLRDKLVPTYIDRYVLLPTWSGV